MLIGSFTRPLSRPHLGSKAESCLFPNIRGVVTALCTYLHDEPRAELSFELDGRKVTEWFPLGGLQLSTTAEDAAPAEEEEAPTEQGKESYREAEARLISARADQAELDLRIARNRAEAPSNAGLLGK